ncbi:MAG: hypothetical protein ABS99_08365 [Acetobacteraceae bacterium SCN 69-10]|nr:MAG: hypothetical protein ABS99_08365 [Acetobacteraceae bacterium SCN 69-10]OJY70980.1 MAG: hypothetical protein BGP12_07735 [Rhodospirillales bacterium 70-18]
MLKRTLLGALAALAVAVAAAPPAQAQARGPNAFDFVAFGDMPYAIPGDYPKLERLIAAINRQQPPFTVFVGDIKGGSTPCTDAAMQKVYDMWTAFEGPLMYSIGDNEWTDCHRPKAGGYDPLERLAKVREMFFAHPEMSLGGHPMPVESEAKVFPDKFATYVENQRWSKNGVLFATVHIPGSNNDFEAFNPKTAMEYFQRNAANIAWIDDTFARAKASGAKAVVLAWQAAVYDIRQGEPEMPRASGFYQTVEAVARGAKAFGHPVLVIHGDNHEFEVNRFLDTKMKPIPMVTRLEVMGASAVHAVRVSVDPDSPGVWGFTPLIVPENGAY